MESWGGTSVRFVDVDAEVRALEFREEGDATQFVKLMREHVGTAAWRVSAEARISAEWKLQHPLWDHRKNHGGERRKLVEIMDDDGFAQKMECRGKIKTVLHNKSPLTRAPQHGEGNQAGAPHG